MNALSFNDLSGKVCVVTGGAGVIGSAMVRALAALGTKVAIINRNGENAKNVAAQIQSETGTDVRGYQGSVLDKENLLAIKSKINEELGEIDLLINCAGGNSPKATTQLERIEDPDKDDLNASFYGLEIEGFDFVFDVNFKGTLLPTMVFTTDMLKNKKGAVLNVSSMNSYKPLTKIPAYSAAKAAINNFTEWLSVHMAKTGIRVNAIAPGFFLTNQNRFLLTDEKTGEPTARGQKIINSTPMERYGEVEELQGTALYLLSDVSKFVTGVCIPVDGGFSAFGGV